MKPAKKNSVLVFAACFAAICCSATLLFAVGDTFFHIDEHGILARTLFLVGMIVLLPGSTVAEWIGLPHDASRSAWVLVEVGTNTLIGLIVGVFVSLARRLLFRAFSQDHATLV